MMKTRYKIFVIAFIGIITLLGIDAFLVEPNMIQVNKVNISDSDTEMKIGFVSDFQRRTSDPLFVQHAVDIMNEEELDVVLIAGDFIDRSLSELPSVDPLKKLKTKHGVFGVLGNHDYNVYFLQRTNANLDTGEKVKNHVESDGTIKILKNENIEVNDISIIGLDSYWAGLRDEGKALENISNEFRILLAHNQDDLEINKETADVYLFGHTHCGQVRLPFLGSVPKMMGYKGDYDSGHYVVNGADVYTTCGLTPAPRFFNPPEITIINLS